MHITFDANFVFAKVLLLSFPCDAVEEALLHHGLFHKPQSIKIFQIAFPWCHPDGRMYGVVVLGIQEMVVAVIHVLKAVEIVPAYAVHPAVLFGPVASFDLPFLC